MRLKRILATALCTLLTTTVCMTLLPAASLAAPASSVSVGGVTLHHGEYLTASGITTTPPADHYAGFSTDGGVATLTLRNFSRNHNASCIQVDNGELTLHLIGANTVTTSSGMSIECRGSLTVTGGGSVSVKGSGGISSNGDVTVDGATILEASTVGSSNIAAVGRLYLKNSSHVTVGACQASSLQMTNSDLTLNAGHLSLTSTANDSEITGSTVHITAAGASLNTNGKLTIDSSEVAADLMQTPKALIVRNGSNITVDMQILAADVSIDGSTVTMNAAASILQDYALVGRDSAGGSGSGNVSITNGSHVTVHAKGGVYAQNNMTVTASTVVATASASSFCAIRSESGSVTFTNSPVTAGSSGVGTVYANSALTLSGGTVTATNTSGAALFSLGTITVDGGVVNATSSGAAGYNYGIYAPPSPANTLTISGGTVTASGGAAGVAVGCTVVTDGTLTAYGAKAFLPYDTTTAALTIGYAKTGKGLIARVSDTPGETNWSAIPLAAEADASVRIHYNGTFPYFNKPSARISAAFPVSGVVKDAPGNPVSGATILVDGVVRGTPTPASGAYKVLAENGAHTVAAEKGAETGSVSVTVNDAPLTGQDITLRAAPVPHITITPTASFPQGGAPVDLTLHIGSAGSPPNSATHFNRLEISGDGTNFSVVDPANYALTFGSIHIALKQPYLNALTPGVYTLHIYLAGAFAGPPYATHITVIAPGGDEAGDAVPKTGDGTPLMPLCGLVLLCGTGLTVTAAVRKRKRAR